MTPALRFRSGFVQLQRFPIDAATVIAPGDLVWLDTDDLKPASSFPWTTDLATTQTAFAAKFVGVAHQSSATGDTTPVSVDTSPLAVYEFAVPAANFITGDLLAPQAASNLLLNQTLVKTNTTAAAIARAVESAASPATIRATFASAVNTASANIHAQLGS